MRALTNTQLSAQQGRNVDAIAKIVLTYGVTTYTYDFRRVATANTRMIRSSRTEEQWSQGATVILNDSDKTLTAINFEGYKGVMSYGYTTSAGDEFMGTAPLWVIGQQRDSRQGRVTCTLSLEGIFDRMKKDKASADYEHDSSDTKTIKSLITEICDGQPVTSELTESQETVGAYTSLYSGSTVLVGQRLVVENRTITKISFKLKSVGIPPGPIKFRMNDADETWLENVTLGTGVASDDITGTATWYEVTLGTPRAITDSTEVYIFCEYSGGDSSNYVDVGYGTTDTKDNENYVDRLATGGWLPNTARECAYRYKFNDAGITVFSHCVSYTVTYDSEDSLIDSFIPGEYFKISANQSRLSVLKELISYTGCEIRPEDDENLHVYVPATALAWSSPTGFVDAGSGWSDEANVYDEDTGTYAQSGIITTGNYSQFLELTIAATNANVIRVWALVGVGTDEIDIDVYYGGAWNDLYEGTYDSLQWFEKSIGSVQSVTSARVRFKNNRAGSAAFRLHELDFGTSYDYEYSLADGEHTFLSKRYRTRVVSPNYVTAKTFPDMSPAYTGFAKDSSADLTSMEEREFKYVKATSNAQCTSIATALLSHYQLEAEQGAGILKLMNIAAEVGDYNLITDSRAGDTATGNVGWITRTTASGNFSMEFGFGKVSVLPLIAMLKAGEFAARAESPESTSQGKASYSDLMDIGDTWDSNFKKLAGEVKENEDDIEALELNKITEKQTIELILARLGLFLPLGGGTMSGIIDMGSNKITSVTDPTAAQDAATKNYVDTKALGLTNSVVTGSRAFDTVYQNTSDNPMLVIATLVIASSGGLAGALIGATSSPATVVATLNNNTVNSLGLVMSFIVPSNWYYKINDASADGSISYWVESILGG